MRKISVIFSILPLYLVGQVTPLPQEYDYYIGKENYQFKMSPLDGVYLKVSRYFGFFSNPSKDLSKVRIVNKNKILDSVRHLVDNLCIKLYDFLSFSIGSTASSQMQMMTSFSPQVQANDPLLSGRSPRGKVNRRTCNDCAALL